MFNPLRAPLIKGKLKPLQSNKILLPSIHSKCTKKGIKGHPAYLLPILANKITLPTNQCVFYATTQDPRH